MFYPVGMIPYANMEPYRQLGEPNGCRFISLVPSESVKEIKLGRVMAAVVPVGGLSQVSDLVEPLGKFGIAARERSMSVLLCSRVPFSSLSKKHKLFLTIESTSSVKLLYLLLGYKNGFENMPMITQKRSFLDGELIIGDRALTRSGIVKSDQNFSKKKINSWNYVTDLAQLWYEIKGYPFVFARWVIRKDVPKAFKISINQWLSMFKEREQELVNRAIEVSARTLKIADIDMKVYFKVIRRILNEKDLFGQRLFLDSFKKHYRKPLFESSN